jgi:hypothetical protein
MTTSKVFIDINEKIIELTGDELIAYQNQIKKNLEDVAIKEAELLQKAAAKAAAEAKLEALGLTAEDLKALGL